MNHLAKRLLFAIILGAALISCQQAEARRPSYLMLRTPTGPPQAPASDRFGSDGYTVNTNTYAYGWFGVSSRRHRSQHSGFYNNYRQWTFK